MKLYELLNELLELLIPCSEEIKDKSTITLNNTSKSKKIFTYKDTTYSHKFEYTKDYPLTFFEIKDTFKYKKTLQTLYQEFSKKNKGIFHIDTIDIYIIQKVLEKKLENVIFETKENLTFFNELNKIQKLDKTLSCPISGISFENKNKTIDFGCFSIGHISLLSKQKLNSFPDNNNNNNNNNNNKTFFPQDVEYYIQMTINQSQDNQVAYEQFISSCDDFMSILLFIAGDVYRKFRVKVGYPVYPTHSTKPDMIIDRPEYYLSTVPLNNVQTEVTYNFESSNFRNLPLDNELLSKNKPLFQLWNLYKEQDLSDINKRILHASIAVGKAIRSINYSESILYSCIALETLFIYNKNLQSRSTNSDMLGHLVKDDFTDDQIDYIKTLAKNIYDHRSTIMHGRKVKYLLQDYMSISLALRQAIINLLTNTKYKTINSAKELYLLFHSTL